MSHVVLLAMAIAVSTCFIAFQQPAMNYTLSYIDDRLIFESASDNTTHALRGEVEKNSQTQIHPIVFTRDPDQLQRFEDHNLFFLELASLYHQLKRGDFSLRGANGQLLTLVLRERNVVDIPLTFWMQLSCAVLALLIGGAVWSLRPTSPQAIAFFICSFGFCLICSSLAVYGSRELVMRPDHFFMLTTLNRFGTYLMIFSGAVLFWYFPRPLYHFPFALCMSALGLLAFANEQMQWVHLPLHDYQAIFIVAAILVLLVGLLQWNRPHLQAVERAALKWVAFSFAFSFSWIIFLYVLPTIVAPHLSMNLELASVLVLSVFVGVAFGVSRYRLFDLERWWYQIWIWFFGGVFIIFVDILLMSVLHLSSTSSITLTIVVTAWLYFPIRQRLLVKLRHKDQVQLMDLLPLVIEFLMKTYTHRQLEDFWQSILMRAFWPLSMDKLMCKPSPISISKDGASLLVPQLSMQAGFELHACMKGQRLFHRDDLALVTQLYKLLAFGNQQNQIRHLSESRERDRIMRDLHDEVCANLLTIIHCSDGATAEMARTTLASLRETIYSLHQDSPKAVDVWLSQVRMECVDHCVDFDLEFQWSADLDVGQMISARQQVYLSRMIRELLTNTIKHAKATTFRLHITVNHEVLKICASDDGDLLALPSNHGNGWHNLKRRCADLEGTLEFNLVFPHGLAVEIQIPMEEQYAQCVDLGRP